MNTTPESPTTSTPDVTILPPTETDHRGNGKVARLPKVLRDQVNRMLDDGFSYKAIIEKLEQSTDPPLPYKLLEINISRWKDNGYQRYLRHQEWRDQLRILRENGSDMSELTDGPKFQETLVQIALTEIFRVLQQGELKPDSLNYIRLFNALARLNREALSLRKYNDHLAKEQAELKQLDINRDISRNEHRAIVDRADRIFRMPRPAPDETSSEPCRSLGKSGPDREEAQTNDQPAEHAPVLRSAFGEGGSRPVNTAKSTSEPSSSRREEALSPPIENPKSKIKNPSSPLPSRPCRAEISSEPCRSLGKSGPDREEAQTNDQPAIFDIEHLPSALSAIENCLDCGSPLPPVPPCALRRPEDHCPSCGMRLPDIGLCYQPGFDHCLNCGATQPALLPGGERPRPHCHKCGERLHNPESAPSQSQS
jgi:hypothetical protein